MKIYGPFHALNNPLVMANMGLFALRQGLDVYNQYQKTQGDEFLKAALVTGQPVGSMPGGPFRRGLSALTGGLVSPNTEASGSTMMDELLGLQQQRSAAMKEVAPLAKEFGSAALGPGGPFAGEAARAGLGGTTLPQTIDELKFAEEQRKNKAQEEANKQRLFQSSPAGKAEAKTAEMQATEAEEATPRYQNLLRNLSFARGAAAREGAASVEFSPAVMGAKTQQAVAEQHAKDVQKEIDTEAAIKNVPIGETGTNSKIKQVYVNADTLEPATGKPGEPKTNGEALNMPDKWRPVPASKAYGPYGVMGARHAIEQLEALKADVPYVFPDTSKMNEPASAIARFDTGVSNLFSKGKDKRVDRFYTALAQQVAFTKELAGRFSMTELNIPMLPDPGALANITGSWNPVKHIPYASSADVANQRLDDMISAIKSVYVPTGDSGTGESGAVFDPKKVEPSK